MKHIITYICLLHVFFISNQNFENRLGYAFEKSLLRLKVCLQYAFS